MIQHDSSVEFNVNREPTFIPPIEERASGIRRHEDWERLTRLEYIVEAIAKEHERQSRELSIVIQTQRDMMSHLKTVKYTVLGILGGLILSQVGLEKTLSILAKIAGLS